MTADEPSLLHHIVHAYVCFQSVACNILLLYLIRNHTPVHMRSYSIMLIFMAIYESFTALSGAMIFARVISLGNEALIAVIYGPCSYLENTYICYSIYGLHLNALTYYNLQMTASFAFRYYVLRSPTPTVRSTVRFNLLLAIPTTICFILYNFGRSPKSDIEHLLLKYVPQYNFNETVIEALVNPTCNPSVATTALVCTTALPCTCLNVFTGSSVHRFLDRSENKLATRTRAAHKQFLKALIMQFIISHLLAIAVVCFLLGHFNIVKTPVLEYAPHFLGELCVALSPLTTLYCVKPYRDKVVGLLTGRKRVAATLDLSADLWSGEATRDQATVVHFSTRSDHL